VQLTRRAAITAAVLAAAGCHRKPKPPPSTPAAPPDIAALRTAGHIEEALLAKYDAEIRRTPKHRRGALQVERAIHATHLAALQVLAAPATGAVTVRGSTTSLLRSSAAELRRFALNATDGAHAALLASIAASHTTGPQ
jgi:hypothetical protein